MEASRESKRFELDSLRPRDVSPPSRIAPSLLPGFALRFPDFLATIPLGGRALNIAADAQGHISILNLLLSKGANPLPKSPFSDTAYDLAFQNKQTSICEAVGSASGVKGEVSLVEGYVNKAKRISNEKLNRREALDHAIQILLLELKNDLDKDSKNDAKILVTMYLDEAELLNNESGDIDSYIEPILRNDVRITFEVEVTQQMEPEMSESSIEPENIQNLGPSADQNHSRIPVININDQIMEHQPNFTDNYPSFDTVSMHMLTQLPALDIPFMQQNENTNALVSLSASSSYMDQGAYFDSQQDSDVTLHFIGRLRSLSQGVNNNIRAENEAEATYIRAQSSERIMPRCAIRMSQWQLDEDAPDCLSCRRKFNLFLRRHHCRWCGLIFCDQDSNARISLSRGDPTTLRVCNNCFTGLISRNSPLTFTPQVSSLPSVMTSPNASSSPYLTDPISLPWQENNVRIILQSRSPENSEYGNVKRDQQEQTISRSMADSMMNECPVCGEDLSVIQSEDDAAEHVNECLVGVSAIGEKSVPIKGDRYIVQFTKSDDGRECEICFEEFLKGQRIARLNCLCQYHETCIQQWFVTQAGKTGARGNCPVHFHIFAKKYHVV
ncbi:hypothetical protein HK096_005644 [Nowakowskiella sp. JEL0078]|nr:hypothetical protein HK096_005644 [Nowakowskiella sp. JEL0078]